MSWFTWDRETVGLHLTTSAAPSAKRGRTWISHRIPVGIQVVPAGEIITELLSYSRCRHLPKPTRAWLNL